MIIDPYNLASGFLAEWHDDKPFITAHSSGSTGTPKEIRLLKTDMETSARATCRFFGINRDSVLVLPLSTDYIAGKMMVVRALVSGATLHIMRPGRSVDISPFSHIDLLPIVPSQIEHILASEHIGNVSNLLIGGAAVSPVQETELLRHKVNAYVSYGMTETCSHVALRKIGNDTPYESLPGITFSTDSRGCLVITMPQFSCRELITNDIVDLCDATHFQWKGRFDNVINSGGVKLHPEEIERQLAGIIDRPFYITGVPDPLWGEIAALYIEGKGSASDGDKIIEKARGILKRYHVPKKVFFIDEFVRTSSGKIKRIAFQNPPHKN